MTENTVVPGLNFLVFYVSDLDASLIYFSQKLGFSYDPEGDSPVFRQLKGAPGSPEFGLVLASAHTPPAGMVEVYFKTADLAGLHRAITERGVEATPIMERPFGPIFSTHSPDGQVVTMLGA